MKQVQQLIALVFAAVLCISAAPPKRLNWNTAIAVTASGSHVLGNPDAKVKLAEYISYTCPHCAHFDEQADGPMRIAYVASGKLSVEVRHLIRDPIDLTVAMLTNCGPANRFFLNHAAFLRSQDKWIDNAQGASPAQRQRWTTGDMASRFRAIAADFQFYDIMESRGYRRTEVDTCLADQAMAKRLAAQTQAARELGVTGTPSFTLNGNLLADTHSWDALEPQLRELK